MKRTVVVLAGLGISLLTSVRPQAAPEGAPRAALDALRAAAAQTSPNALAVETASWDVVASGLDNPRGLSFGPDGALYVAEAGIGGGGPCRVGPEGNEECYGETGAITRVLHGEQARVVEGLPSLAADGGFAATGPTDVTASGTGVLEAIIGWGGEPEARADLGEAGARFGHVVRLVGNGPVSDRADVAAYEIRANPDGGAIDSNPYAIQALSPGRSVVADAGGNDLLAATTGRGNNLRTLAVFPDRMVPAPPFLGLPPGALIPMQAVPTCVTAGPDGAYYVGQLTGFPFPVGGANVYRVVPGWKPEVYADGFTNVIDVAFGGDGSLYVLEIAKNGLLSDDLTGALIRVAPDGTRTELASEGLVAPGGLAVGPDGALYVSNFSIFPGAGQVVRITP